MTPQEIGAALAAPFPADVIGWKPGAVSGERAMALAYIDARDVMDRLDAVVGIDGWHDEYEFLADGAALCRLYVRLGDAWLCKIDVGSESDQSDSGDRHKAAISDAIKRAAVKFGVGRYLYSLPSQWLDWDPQKRQFRSAPTLPAWARPKPALKPEQPALKPAQPADPEQFMLFLKEKPDIAQFGNEWKRVQDKPAIRDAFVRYAKNAGWFMQTDGTFGENCVPLTAADAIETNSLAGWIEFLAAQPELPLLNNRAPQIADLIGVDKVKVKKLLVAHAKNRGWAWSEQCNGFAPV